MPARKFADLREFLTALEKLGELKTIEGADWDLEIGALTELVAEQDGPALLFDKIKGYPEGYRVASNFWASLRRCALLFDLPLQCTGLDVVRRFREIKRDYKPIPPIEVKDGRVLENVYTGDEVDMLKFPTPLWHELDGGRYIGTGSVTILRDPEGGRVNFGTYRVMIHDRTTLAFYKSPGTDGSIIRQRYWEKGENCPIAISFGQDPAIFTASTFKLPPSVAEYDFAGFLRGAPVEVIWGKVTGLPFPAHAEIVIEGESPPPEVEQRMEGPFGESPGYYGAGVRPEAVIRVKALYHRHNPILEGAPPLKPPLHYSPRHTFWKAVEDWDLLEAAGFPDIKGVYNLDAGRHSICVISLKQRYASHAKGAGLLVASGGYFCHFVIVVDEDIDPSDPNDVFWAISTRCDPATSIDIVRGLRSSALDAALPPDRKAAGDLTSSTAVINACRPYHWKDQFPPVNKVSDQVRSRMLDKWGDLLKELKGPSL